MVTNLNDNLTNYALQEGTFRTALENARVIPGANTISLPFPSGTITLAGGLPLLDHDVTVNGPSPGQVTLRGNDTFRIVETRGTVNFNHLVFRNGLDPLLGGAIFNRGTLSLSACTLTANAASARGSALANFASGGPGVLSMSNCVVSGNTGAAAVDIASGPATIGTTAFSGNTGGNISGLYTDAGGNSFM